MQAAEMEFLRRFHCVTLRDKVRSSKIRKALNDEPLLRIEKSLVCWFGHVSRMSHERLARQVLLVTPKGKRPTVAHSRSLTNKLSFLSKSKTSSRRGKDVLPSPWNFLNKSSSAFLWLLPCGKTSAAIRRMSFRETQDPFQPEKF